MWEPILQIHVKKVHGLIRGAHRKCIGYLASDWLLHALRPRAQELSEAEMIAQPLEERLADKRAGDGGY